MSREAGKARHWGLRRESPTLLHGTLPCEGWPSFLVSDLSGPTHSVPVFVLTNWGQHSNPIEHDEETPLESRLMCEKFTFAR